MCINPSIATSYTMIYMYIRAQVGSYTSANNCESENVTRCLYSQ